MRSPARMERTTRSTGGEDYGDEIPKFENTFSRFVSDLTRAKCQVTELKRKEQAWLGEKEALLKTIRKKDEELEGSRSEARELEGRVTSLEEQLEEERAKSRHLKEKGRLEASNEVGDGREAVAAPCKSNRGTDTDETGSQDGPENSPKVEFGIPKATLRRSTRTRILTVKGKALVSKCEDIRPQAAGSERTPGIGNGTTSVPSSTCGSSQEEAEVLTTQQASNLPSRNSSGEFCKRKTEAANNRTNDESDAEDASISTESAKKSRADVEFNLNPSPEQAPTLESRMEKFPPQFHSEQLLADSQLRLHTGLDRETEERSCLSSSANQSSDGEGSLACDRDRDYDDDAEGRGGDAAMPVSAANKEGKFVCPTCSYPFARINALKKHMKLNRCGNKGGRQTNASVIAALEALPRPFVCEKCNWAFRRSHHLADHVNHSRCGKKGGRPRKSH